MATSLDIHRKEIAVIEFLFWKRWISAYIHSRLVHGVNTLKLWVSKLKAIVERKKKLIFVIVSVFLDRKWVIWLDFIHSGIPFNSVSYLNTLSKLELEQISFALGHIWRLRVFCNMKTQASPQLKDQTIPWLNYLVSFALQTGFETFRFYLFESMKKSFGASPVTIR